MDSSKVTLHTAHAAHAPVAPGVSVAYFGSGTVVTPEDMRMDGWSVHSTHAYECTCTVISCENIRFSSGQVTYQIHYGTAFGFQSFSHFLATADCSPPMGKALPSCLPGRWRQRHSIQFPPSLVTPMTAGPLLLGGLSALSRAQGPGAGSDSGVLITPGRCTGSAGLHGVSH